MPSKRKKRRSKTRKKKRRTDRFPRIPDELHRHINELGRPLRVSELQQRSGVRNWMRANAGLPAVSTAAALLTVPSFHANTCRIEALIHLLLAGGEGTSIPDHESLHRMLNVELRDTNCARREDPVEDVFVSNVLTSEGDRLLFQGNWESIDFYCQRIYETLNTIPGTDRLLRHVHALLRISNAIAQRRALHRYTPGTGIPTGEIDLPSDADLADLHRSVEFTHADLSNIEVHPADIDPFVLPENRRQALRDAFTEYSDLHDHPIVRNGDRWIVALPTAIGHSINMFVGGWIEQQGLAAEFDTALAQEYRKVLADVPLLGHPISPEAMAVRSPRPGTSFIESMIAFSPGRFCHLIAIVTGLQAPSAETPDGSTKQIREMIETRIRQARRAVRGTPRFAQGLSIIVGCASVPTALPILSSPYSDWWIEFVTAPDYLSLVAADTGKELLLWRLLEQVYKLKAHGLDFLDTNGLLNLFAYWRDNGFLLLPSRSDLEVIPNGLTIDIDYVADVRLKLRHGYDLHAVKHPDGRQSVVQRKTVESFFAQDELQPLYASKTDLQHGLLLGLWEGHLGRWWIHAAHENTALSRDLIYKVWDSATNWLASMVPQIESAGIPPRDQDLEYVLDFSQCSEPDVRYSSEPPENPSPFRVAIEQPPMRMRLYITDQFLSSLRRPDNVAERALVQSMLEALWQLLRRTPDPVAIDSLLDRIVPNKDARYIHAFAASTFREIIGLKDPQKALLIGEADASSAKLGVAWHDAEAGKLARIGSVQAATLLLNQTVESLYQRIRAQCSQLDRRQTISLALRTIEGIYWSRQQWEYTARAVLALRHNDNASTETIVNYLARCNGSTLALRLLVEVALQESPLSGGHPLGVFDLRRILADLLFLFHLGGASEAIFRNVMSPEIAVAANGDILFKSGFYDSVITPFGQEYGALEVQHHVETYEAHLQEREITPTVAGHLNPAFLEAFSAEFGYTVDQLILQPHLRLFEGGGRLLLCRSTPRRR